MKRVFSLIAALAITSTMAGCGDGIGSILDGLFNTGDMAMSGGPDMAIPLFRLPEGVWKVSGPVTMLNDGCMVDPNNAMNPTAGQIWALINECPNDICTGRIKLGNPTDP